MHKYKRLQLALTGLCTLPLFAVRCMLPNTTTGEIIWQKTVGKDEVQRAWMYPHQPSQRWSRLNRVPLEAAEKLWRWMLNQIGEELWNAALAGTGLLNPLLW